MTEHRRNIFVMECLEAQAYYNARIMEGKPAHAAIMRAIAEAYLMRVESLTTYNTER